MTAVLDSKSTMQTGDVVVTNDMKTTCCLPALATLQSFIIVLANTAQEKGENGCAKYCEISLLGALCAWKYLGQKKNWKMLLKKIFAQKMLL